MKSQDMPGRDDVQVANTPSLTTVLLFVLLLVIILLSLIYVSWQLYTTSQQGLDLNRHAWEAAYLERNLDIPKKGPREGYWGSRLGEKVPDRQVGWHEPEVHVHGLLDVDQRGYQYYRPAGEVQYRILILGGSVGFGAYASEISTTYFYRIGQYLEQSGIGVEITVVSAGAWKSVQEVRALQRYLGHSHPDLVVFLDGLNDLTNGATSAALYGEKVKTRDGSKYTALYHVHDYQQRVADYLVRMDEAFSLLKPHRLEMLVVLQPALFERKSLTEIEYVLLEASLKPHMSRTVLLDSYEAMRKGLMEKSARFPALHYLDASRAFAGEPETIFADMWHFADRGHELLGDAMAGKILDIATGSSSD